MNKDAAIRITVIGDSISQGLGNQHYNFCKELKEEIERRFCRECEICNLSLTGKTIYYANEIKKDIVLSSPDVIIIFLGSVDGIIRPKQSGRLWRIIPKRYKKNGMLDPRPFFSHIIYRALFEHMDSWFRWHLKLLLMKLYGTYCWVELNDFEVEYRAFLHYFQNKNILAISPVYIDEKYFPGSNDNLRKYADCISKLVCEFEKAYIDLIELQKHKKWSDIYNADHFHPSLKGYSWLSDIIASAIHQHFGCIQDKI